MNAFGESPCKCKYNIIYKYKYVKTSRAFVIFIIYNIYSGQNIQFVFEIRTYSLYFAETKKNKYRRRAMTK